MQEDLKHLDIPANPNQVANTNLWQRIYNNLVNGNYKRLPFKILVEENWFTDKIYKVIPRHKFAPLMYELYIAIETFRLRDISKKYADATDLLVNLGCGVQGKPGWINVDAGSWPGVNCVYDCRKKLPFPNNSVKGIFCEHFFEHLDYKEEVPTFLSECHRVLKPGGIIRIIVPDAGKYIEAYFAEGWDKISQIRRLNSEHLDPYTGDKYQTKMEVINAIFRQGFEHKYAYDYTTLELVLYQAGFAKVEHQDFGQSLIEELCIDLEFRASESLYVEAVKGSI